MTRRDIATGARTAALFIPEGARVRTLIYIHMDAQRALEAASLMTASDAGVVAIDGVDWDAELSPWPAKRAFRGGEDFSGGADAYIDELTSRIIPAVEAELGEAPAVRAIAGYSLAGLFALYALWKTDAFACAAGISGSLWYDGFADYILTNPLVALPRRIYLSLGERESRARDARLARVGECTAQTAEFFRRIGVNTTYELNPGGHFDDVAARIARGLDAIATES